MASQVQQQFDTDCSIEVQHPAKGQASELGLSNRILIKPKRCQRQALRTFQC
ncbi:hypothetical protein D3C78_777590 [compost metagenome]